ncbi:cyclopropane-fatty-acyl-phospholipid synthase [Fomitopsis serialis]|uniref:cyclopropane-fatty-acyl-phospholipid synthase n=1 Tax=Fomitopsis serialis TaxID=139415 RepID=UPI0020080180|nr:cyclopropane-fatty-acyl-phospholipid synthase [Neoantrodia serialis]KAH9922658.1 cyclopropane-fatty-acyl-phospholipid synthase [Neoantrodia serialis]
MAEDTRPDKKHDTWSAANYQKTASFVFSNEFTAPVLTLLDAKPGERIIDVGCGSGEVTLQIQQLVGETGVVHAFVGDAQAIDIPSTWDASLKNYDAVFSNAALHWCKQNPRGVVESAKRLLKPGGRFVVEMGGQMNCIGVRAALHHVLRNRGYKPEELDPWYFPSTADYKSYRFRPLTIADVQLLESAGFDVQTISLHPRITPLNGAVIDWLRLFARPHFLANMVDKEAEEIMEAVQEMCAVDCRDSQGRWSMVYIRLRFVAVSRA